MKKLLFLFPILLSPSCAPKNEKILAFSYRGAMVRTDEGNRTQCLNVSQALPELLKAKTSFPLFVYAPGCGTCDLSTREMDKYLERTGALFPYATSGYFEESTGKRIDENTIVIFQEGEEVTRHSMGSEKNLDDFLEQWIEVSEVEVLNSCQYSTAPSYFYPNYIFSDEERTFDPLESFLGDGKSRILILPKDMTQIMTALESLDRFDVDGLLFVDQSEKESYEERYDWNLSDWESAFYLFNCESRTGENISLP